MDDHNRPHESVCLECGNGEFKEGPNCPACRTLIGPAKIEKNCGYWQGWSGLFYCGKNFTKPSEKKCKKTGKPWHDGFCGPDYGPQCPECKERLYSKN